MLQTFLTSWEIISHNTVIWTGDVNLDYKIGLVLVLWTVKGVATSRHTVSPRARALRFILLSIELNIPEYNFQYL